MSRRAVARSRQLSVPISALIVAKNDSAAAPSRQDPVRLVLCRMPRRRSALRYTFAWYWLTSTIRVHDRVTRNQPGPVRGTDRVYRETGAHMGRERVSDHLPATKIHNSRKIQPSLVRHEAADVTDQLQARHRRGELPPNQIRNRSSSRIRPGQVATSAPGDSGDAVLPHQPAYDAPSHRDAAALQLTRDAKHTVGRVRRVYLEDQRGQPPLVVLSIAAPTETAHPSAVIGAIGNQDPTQQLDAEPVTPLVDERKALPRRRMVRQRLRRFAQDLVLAAQIPVFAQATTQLLTRLRERNDKIITCWSTGHDGTLPCPRRKRRSLNRTVPQRRLKRGHSTKQKEVPERADSKSRPISVATRAPVQRWS